MVAAARRVLTTAAPASVAPSGRAAVEDEARRRGARQIGLSTHSFHTPGFCRRHGFEVTGEIRDYPAGHSCLLMRMALG